MEKRYYASVLCCTEDERDTEQVRRMLEEHDIPEATADAIMALLPLVTSLSVKTADGARVLIFEEED